MRRISGHHVEQDGAVLGAVNASALRAARGPGTGAASGIDRASAQRGFSTYVVAHRMADFDGDPQTGVCCANLVGVGHDTSSALPNAERAAASVPSTLIARIR
jgi:hypothetical protein